MNVDILEFEGKMNGDIFLDWLYTVDRVFDYKELSDERKVKLVAIKLRGYASLWWENLKKERDRLGKDRIRSWEKMKKELKKRFLTENYKQEIFLKFYNFKQGALSIEDYTREFEYLMLRCDMVEPEEQTIARYLGGMKDEICNIVRLQPFWTFTDVRKLPINVEKQRETKKYTYKSNSFKSSSSTT